MTPRGLWAAAATLPPWHTGGGGLFDPRLKALIRLRIATGVAVCCARAWAWRSGAVSEDEAARGVDAAHDGVFTARERAAIRFAEKIAAHHHNIGDDDVAAMRRLFTDSKFLELWRGSTSALAGCWPCCSWRWRAIRCEQGFSCRCPAGRPWPEV